MLINICNFAPGKSKLLSMSSIKRLYLRGKQTQILRGQQRRKWECKNDINGNAVYYCQFKKKYRINSFLMQELKLYMA